MGVEGLAGFLKTVATEDVDLSVGGGRGFLVDGHFMMHQAASGRVAAALVLEDDEVPLFEAVSARLERVVEAGWDVVVVFDGATPPGKLGTSQHRSDKREKALRDTQDAHARRLPRAQVERLARGAVRFSSEVTAKVATRLLQSIRVQCIIAPYEADPQIRVLEEMLTRGGRECYVWATDSDLCVLGVNRLLYELNSRGNGKLSGRCISRAKFLLPQDCVLRRTDHPPYRFLRLLHGICSEDELRDGTFQTLDEAQITERLLRFACITGNDYAKFKGVGPASAADIALRQQPASTTSPNDVIVEQMAAQLTVKAHDGSSAADLGASINKASDMFRHGVAFDPRIGRHRHLSGQESTPALLLLTGSFSPPDVAKTIARVECCPVELIQWDPPIGNRIGKALDLGLGGGSGMFRNKRSRLDSPRETSNNRTGLLTLPAPNTDFDTMTVSELRGFVGHFRCFESAGLSTANKATLIEMATKAVIVVNRARLINSELAMRRPFVRSTSAERIQSRLPDLPQEDCWVKDWKDLRTDLPEMSEAVIVEWFQQGSPQLNVCLTSRVLYRGLQRTMDLGILSGLWGVPCGPGNILWLRLSTTPSMRVGTYEVFAVVQMAKLNDDGIDDAIAEDSDSSDEDRNPPIIQGDRTRLVATRVVDAYCTCQSGLPGACHHVCQLLQVVRLLQMTARQLRAWDPETVTGRACEWLLKNSRAGRDPTDNVFWLKQLPEIGSLLRTLRDPKKQQNGSDTPAHTAGVVVGNRSQDFNPHPSGGVWAEREENFNKADTITRSKLDKFNVFINRSRRGEERAIDKHPPLCDDTSFDL